MLSSIIDDNTYRMVGSWKHGLHCFGKKKCYVAQALYVEVECSNKILHVRLLRIIAPRTSLASSFGDFATAKNKLRELIMGSERKRGSVPDGPPLACRAHASGMHSRFCDTVGQECGLIMMNLSHVEDEPEPQTTRVAHFSHPSHELSMAAGADCCSVWTWWLG